MTTQQLEVYLDTLNKDNDEENHQFILTHMDSPSSNVENACDSDYFIDQDGNYYIQNGEAATEQSNDAKSLSPCKPETATGNTQSVLVGKDEDDDIDFVFIMDNDKDADANANGDGEDDTAHAETDNYALDDADDPTYEIMDNDGEAASSKAGAKGANVIQCDSCSYTTHKRFLLSRHMQTHSDDRPHKCTVCERGFKTSITLINHVNTHLGNKPHACKTCGMCFTTSGELVRHVRYRHTGEKPHKCPECDYASVELSKLRRHIRCHTGERPYQCPHCTYASPDTFKLKRHMRTHTGEKPYECDICLSRFTQSNSLKAHKLIHSVGDKPVFQCTLCPTTCGRKTDLRMHIQNLHHSEKPVPCKRCGQEFPDRYTYKVHLKTHEGEKCFRCTICPYASSTMRHLESHMLVHTDQKPFTCTQCPKAFRQQQLLNRHVNLYHNTEYVPPKPRDKNHTCPHCDRAFTHKGGLMRHMATHDPKSTFHSEKMKLKLGRMTKITPDGSFRKTTYEDESTYDSEKDTDDGARERDDADTKEFIEVIEEQNEFDDNTNEELDEAQSIEEPDFKPLLHSDGAVNKAVSKKFVSLQVEDGEDFMLVEVIRCEDDDDEENSIEDSATAIAESNTFVTKSSKDVENCFGFEEYSESYDSKKGLQIINLMN